MKIRKLFQLFCSFNPKSHSKLYLALSKHDNEMYFCVTTIFYLKILSNGHKVSTAETPIVLTELFTKFWWEIPFLNWDLIWHEIWSLPQSGDSYFRLTAGWQKLPHFTIFLSLANYTISTICTVAWAGWAKIEKRWLRTSWRASWWAIWRPSQRKELLSQESWWPDWPTWTFCFSNWLHFIFKFSFQLIFQELASNSGKVSIPQN